MTVFYSFRGVIFCKTYFEEGRDFVYFKKKKTSLFAHLMSYLLVRKCKSCILWILIVLGAESQMLRKIRMIANVPKLLVEIMVKVALKTNEEWIVHRKITRPAFYFCLTYLEFNFFERYFRIIFSTILYCSSGD